MQLQLHYTNYTTPQLQLHYTTTTTTAALHHTTSSSCGWGDRPGDHCNHCSHSKKHSSNHLSVHQWIRSAIRDSQQPISPIGFLFLKLPPPPCAVLRLTQELSACCLSHPSNGRILGPNKSRRCEIQLGPSSNLFRAIDCKISKRNTNQRWEWFESLKANHRFPLCWGPFTCSIPFVGPVVHHLGMGEHLVWCEHRLNWSIYGGYPLVISQFAMNNHHFNR